MSKTRIQIIGNYFEDRREALLKKEIIADSFISNCNPLAMVGDTDSELVKKIGNKTPRSVDLMIRKNLKELLSHESGSGNRCEYIVVCNNLFGYSLFLYNNNVYSDSGVNSDLLKLIKTKGVRVTAPYPIFFNALGLYDKFIDTVLSEYDSEHIILIRTNAMKWYLNNGDLIAFDKRAADMSELVQEMDDRFAERCRCHCIDVMCAHVPVENIKCAFPYMPRTEAMYSEVEDALSEIINQHSDKYKVNISAVKDRNAAVPDTVIADILTGGAMDEEHSRLSGLLRGTNGLTISDHIAGILSGDISDNIKTLELAATHLNPDLSDIMAIVKLYQRADDKSRFKGVVRALCLNSGCYPLRAAGNRLRENLAFLKDYEYIEEELLGIKTEVKCIALDDERVICFDPSSEKPIKIIPRGADDAPDTDAVSEVDVDGEAQDDALVRRLTEAAALCSDWQYYIQRARSGKVKSPVTLCFDSVEEFQRTLSYVDYVQLTGNEAFYITAQGLPERKRREEQPARADLSFLFDKNVHIAYIGGDTAEQAACYLYAKQLEKRIGGSFYYDDLSYTVKNGIAEMELHGMIKEDISSRCLSRIVSPALISSFGEHLTIADALCANGFTDIYAMTDNTEYLRNIKICEKMYFPSAAPEKLADFVLKHNNADTAIEFVCGGDRETIPLDADLCGGCFGISPTSSEEAYFELFEEIDNNNSVVIIPNDGDFLPDNFDAAGSYESCFAALLDDPAHTDMIFYLLCDETEQAEMFAKEHLNVYFRDNSIRLVQTDGIDLKLFQLICRAKVYIGQRSFVSMLASVICKGRRTFFIEAR